MSGWTRLALVLSLIYWTVAGAFITVINGNLGGDQDGTTAGVVVFFVFCYACAVGLWWALSAFLRRQ